MLLKLSTYLRNICGSIFCRNLFAFIELNEHWWNALHIQSNTFTHCSCGMSNLSNSSNRSKIHKHTCDQTITYAVVFLCSGLCWHAYVNVSYLYTPFESLFEDLWDFGLRNYDRLNGNLISGLWLGWLCASFEISNSVVYWKATIVLPTQYDHAHYPKYSDLFDVYG